MTDRQKMATRLYLAYRAAMRGGDICLPVEARLETEWEDLRPNQRNAWLEVADVAERYLRPRHEPG